MTRKWSQNNQNSNLIKEYENLTSEHPYTVKYANSKFILSSRMSHEKEDKNIIFHKNINFTDST